MKNFFKRSGGIIIAAIIAEITLRVLGFPSINTNTFDKNNLVIFKPNQQFLVKDRCYSNILKTNDQGFHSASYSIKKPANTFRIVVLGNSFVEAVQVPIEKIFTSILEKKLNQQNNGIRYEVIPIAKSGNGTLMNLMYAKKYAMQYNPDLLIDGFISNDLQNDLTAGDTLHATFAGNIYDTDSFRLSTSSSSNPYFLFLKHFFLERSLLFERWWMNLTVLKNQFNQGNKQSSEQAEPAIDSFVGAQLEPQSTLSEQMWSKEDKALRTMNQFAKDNHTKFLLVHLTEGYLIDPQELQSRYGLSPDQVARFNPNMIQQKLTKIASMNSFPFFSTQSYFTKNFKNTGNLPVLSCDNHYNEIGHEWVAEAIFQYLTNSSNRLIL